MNEVSLTARRRQEVGTGWAKALRRAGKLPAVIYGSGKSPEPLELDRREFEAFMRKRHGENVVINLQVDANDTRMALLREVQRNPLSDALLHVDFQHISMTQRLTMDVPILLVGRAIGASRERGGILQQSLRELSITCLASDIPEHIEVDVSALDIGDSIHVRDLSIPRIGIGTHGETVIATVVPPMREEEAVPVTEELAEPELIERPRAVDEEKEEQGR
ncbi:MAG: 50S ribosomal protein L25 [Candidatus Latescibacteria bacterium]|nr:50S ribosomal protein L25 [Candidatus Latescibacterota bacterium]